MTQFVNNDVASGAIVFASDHNTQGALLAAVVNGGLDNDNMAANAAIAGSKLADDSVPAAKIDFGGSGAGVWWEEIDRISLTPAGDTLSVASFDAKKYLRVIVHILSTGGTTSGVMTLNGDTGANYSRRLTNNDTQGTVVSQTGLSLLNTAAQTALIDIEIVNAEDQEKLILGQISESSTAGAGTAPGSLYVAGKWANTADQITTVTFTNGGTGNYAIGSQIIVLGHD